MATATSKLNIIVDVLGDQAERGLKGIQGALSQIAVVTGTVVAAGYAAKQAWDFAKEGAELELVATQFANVAENAGYTADVLLGKMREATGGMVSDAELMASGLDIIELGLADSEQGVVDLATVVSTLGLDMQQVIMTFANDSVMRLDALGLSVEKVTKRAEELKAEGFVGDAFDQAVLEGLTERMQVLGDVTQTTAGMMAQFEVATTNAWNEFKMGASEAVAPALEMILVEKDLEAAYQSGIISMDQYRRMADDLGFSLEEHRRVKEELLILEEQYIAIQAMMASEAADADQIFSKYTDAVDGTAGAFEDLNSGMSVAIGNASSLSTNIGDITEKLHEQIEFISAGGGVVHALIAASQQALNEGDLGLATKLADEASIAATDVQLELDQLDATEAALQLASQLGIGFNEAELMVQDLESSIFAMTSQTYLLKFKIEVQGTVPGVNTPIPGSGGGGGGGGGYPGLPNAPDNPGIQGFNPISGSGDIFVDAIFINAGGDNRRFRELVRDAASAAAGSGDAGVF